MTEYRIERDPKPSSLRNQLARRIDATDDADRHRLLQAEDPLAEAGYVERDNGHVDIAQRRVVAGARLAASQRGQRLRGVPAGHLSLISETEKHCLPVFSVH